MNAQSPPLSTAVLRNVDAYWRAANYLAVGQIYLYDNPLLKKPLTLAHVKPRLLGQASGPLVGGALFVWQMNAPYVLSGGVLVAIALVIIWKALAGRRATACTSGHRTIRRRIP